MPIIPERISSRSRCLAGTPILILARKDFPPKDLKEFVAYVKANVDKVNAAHAGVGSVSHVSCELLNSILDIKPVGVPFNGTGPAMNALVGGQVDYMCDQIVNAVPQINGRHHQGLCGGDAGAQSVAARRADHDGGRPAGLPGPGAGTRSSRRREPRRWSSPELNAAAAKALDDETVRKRLLDLGSVIPAAGRPHPAGARRRS